MRLAGSEVLEVEPFAAEWMLAQRPAPQLSVIVPTFNEAGNAAELVKALDRAMPDIAWEVIFVDDDSPDGTAAAVRQLAAGDHRIRCIRRIGRRGLSGATIEGMLASTAGVVAVMDGDLQHDEALLARMFGEIAKGADLVIGTRYADGQTPPSGLNALRQKGSAWATAICKRLLKIRATDPLSGFFMIRREAVDAIAPKLSTQGFKILLDILATQKTGLRVVELPFEFRARRSGQSKLDELVVIEYLSLILAKATGDALSIRFILFAFVGASGVVVHLLALKAGLALGALAFTSAQAAASYAAMTWNFFLNNQLTYRDRRLKGLGALKGLLSFYAVCSVGTLANVGVAHLMYGDQTNWWIAGTAGALMGAVFNYAATSIVTWRRA